MLHASATACSVAVVLVIGAIMVAHMALWGRMPPGTIVGTTDISLLSLKEAKIRIEREVEDFLKSPRALIYEGKEKTFTPKDLGLYYDVESALERIMPIGPDQSLLRFFYLMVQNRAVPLPTKVDVAQLSSKLLENFQIAEKPPKNASIDIHGGILVIRSEEKGLTLDIDEIARQLKKQSTQPIEITLKEIPASITSGDWERVLPKIKEAIKKPITLKWEDWMFSVVLQKHFDWLEPIGAELVLNEKHVEEFIEKQIANITDRAPVAAEIRKENGRIIIEGHAKKGTKLVRSYLKKTLQDAINNGATEIDLMVSVVDPPLDVDPELRGLGIEDLIATGYTNFIGSPPNRINNIQIGLARYNGLLIAPDEIFSFNGKLGPVTAQEGYRQELVIKPEGTIPEYGGGLCQVSSTVFRAALYAGLPIIERFPHFYAVPYYARPGGQGLDATIYPGSKDLKFKNDTPGHLLLQTFTEGTDAYVNVFGIADGRTVELTDYKTWDIKDPPEPIIAETTDLPPGEKKQVDRAHDGISASWVRKIKKNGEEVSEKIVSTYKPWPARYLIGVSVKDVDNAVRVMEGALPEE